VTRHAENTDTQDNTDVNDLTSPSSHRWGISLSDTAEFRRAPSPQAGRRADRCGAPGGFGHGGQAAG
jgi:hypothetical protein